MSGGITKFSMGILFGARSQAFRLLQMLLEGGQCLGAEGLDIRILGRCAFTHFGQPKLHIFGMYPLRDEEFADLISRSTIPSGWAASNAFAITLLRNIL